MSDRRSVTVQVHREDGHYWAEVEELPGCFACGETLEELWEVLAEGIGLYLSDDDEKVTVQIQEIGEATEIEQVERRELAVCV